MTGAIPTRLLAKSSTLPGEDFTLMKSTSSEIWEFLEVILVTRMKKKKNCF